jgi:hypothetical protein
MTKPGQATQCLQPKVLIRESPIDRLQVDPAVIGGRIGLERTVCCHAAAQHVCWLFQLPIAKIPTPVKESLQVMECRPPPAEASLSPPLALCQLHHLLSCCDVAANRATMD